MLKLKNFFITVAILSGILSLCFILFLKKLNHKNIYAFLMIFSVFFILILFSQREIIDRINTAKGIAHIINSMKSEDDLIINYGSFDQTLLFYVKKRLIIVSYRGELHMGSRYEDAKGYFIGDDDFIKIMGSEKRVFCVVKEKKLSHVKEKLSGSVKPIKCENEYCVFTNDLYKKSKFIKH